MLGGGGGGGLENHSNRHKKRLSLYLCFILQRSTVSVHVSVISGVSGIDLRLVQL